MKLIVADAYGTGYLESSEHGRRELSPDEWSEVDVRDVVHAGDQGAVVRYRDDGREVVVGAGEMHDIEYRNDDVIDLRGATDAADRIAVAIEGLGTNEDEIFAALATIPTDDTRERWLEQLEDVFRAKTGRVLVDALRDELSGDDLDRALELLR
jgi:hypothetical protein